MPSDTKYKTADIAEALLYEAKQIGVRSFTRTALTKYLYLLDYWMAKENNGKTFIGVEWKFYHYGPYSEALASHIDFLPTLPFINKVDVSRENKDFTVYSLGEYTRNKTLESIGISSNVKGRLLQAIKAFVGDLNGLLNYVYFETEPMDGVKPGDVLSFENLRKQNFKQDIKQIKVQIDNKEKAARIKALISNIGSKWQESQNNTPLKTLPLRDSHYLEAIEPETIINDGKSHFGTLKFSNES